MPVYKNKKGTWYASFYYTEWNGNRKKKKKEGFKTKKEAQEYEREFIAKQNGSTDMTMGSLIELYFADCADRLKITTNENKHWLIETKILPYFADVPVRDVSPNMVRRWQNKLLKDPAGYAPTYLKSINNQLSAIMNFAIRYYGLQSNPVVLCGPFGKKKAEEMQFWTKEEFYKFIECIKDKPAGRLAFEVLFWTGMRSGELLALTLEDVDFDKSTISITKTAAQVKGQTIISDPKTTKSKRKITVPNFILALIKDYTDRLVGYQPTDRIFYFTKHYLQTEMKRGCKLSGVKKIRVHDLRHSHASLLIEMRCSIKLVAERLGHENIQTTLQTYAHLYPNKQGELSAQFDESEAERMSELLKNYDKNSGS
ncbi:MAG: site-specific integrase [Clostridiales bacterium]|nr:site-specific integrase [Clostridiales bacterium]